MDKYEIEDLVSSAITQKPTDFSDAFAALIMPRIQTAVANKKQEIARQMYAHEVGDDEGNPEDTE